MSIQIIGFPHVLNQRLAKVKIAATIAGVKADVVSGEGAQADMTLYKQNCQPLGAAPVLQTEQGYIFESGAMLRHVGRLGKAAGLYGSTDFEASQIDSWIDFVTTEIDPSAMPFVGAKFGFVTLSAEEVAANTKTVLAAFEGIDKWLEVRTFLVGERITIADVAVFTAFDGFVRLAPAALEGYKFKNLVRLYMTVLHNAKVQEAIVAMGGDGLVPAKPKAEAPKKEEKPKKAAAAAEADDEDEPAAAEVKKPNPLDALPPSTFVLDAFKREYSNTDTRAVAAPYFFQNYDAAGFTCYWCNYKYNADNKMQFMTANLIRGWFQRMDHVRKYGFGCALIVGEDNCHDITAFWVFRGKGMPEIVASVDDSELFEWTEIADVQAEKDKITDYLCWEGKTISKPVLEGRCFK
jgi:elongation factor 1-gamma